MLRFFAGFPNFRDTFLDETAVGEARDVSFCPFPKSEGKLCLSGSEVETRARRCACVGKESISNFAWEQARLKSLKGPVPVASVTEFRLAQARLSIQPCPAVVTDSNNWQGRCSWTTPSSQLRKLLQPPDKA